ncbi:hypothetical protein E4U43_004789 [Claviceps pusilla]|uniref:Uncharacterized protein n=1 Tax=Claviceps pusilla TaxID=123648 RepID=A0A9P7STR2_9HYPO|nr:hypothetical protein E4U43_004789 [Claviceps pusilla]
MVLEVQVQNRHEKLYRTSKHKQKDQHKTMLYAFHIVHADMHAQLIAEATPASSATQRLARPSVDASPQS